MTFTNETLDLSNLPRLEAVSFEKPDRAYWNVVLLNLTAVFLVLGIAVGLLIAFADEVRTSWPYVVGLYLFVLLASVVLARIGFLKKAYAFREHDVLFRHGILATETIVIPYNRVQHVELHEGVFSRMFHLAQIGVFTAGGNSGDIQIPGLSKALAENIEQLLMGKIQKKL